MKPVAIFVCLLAVTLFAVSAPIFADEPVGEKAWPPIMFPNTGSWGINIHTPLRDKPIRDLGAQWVRIDLRWSQIEKEAKGQYVWDEADKRVHFYLEHGYRTIVVLAVEKFNPLYQQQEQDKDQVIQAITQWMGAVAERYAGKNIVWELGNEPEAFPMNGYWNDPHTYAKMAIQASQRIKQVDPTSKVAALSLAWVDRTFAIKALEDGLLDGGHIDLLSFHGYHRRDTSPESGLAQDIAWFRQMIGKYAPKGKVIDVIDSERSYAVLEQGTPKHWAKWRNKLYSLQQQAAYLARHYLEEIYNGIEVSVWYKDMRGEEQRSLYYRVETDPRGLRPMGHVYRNLANLLPDNPKRMVNTRYPISLVDLPDHISAPDSMINVRSFLRSYVHEQGSQQQLIVAMWYPVEAFEGKILQERKRVGENYIETWRDVTENDHISIPLKVQVAGLNGKVVSKAYSCDLLANQTQQMNQAISFQQSTDRRMLHTDVFQVGSMPVILVFVLEDGQDVVETEVDAANRISNGDFDQEKQDWQFINKGGAKGSCQWINRLPDGTTGCIKLSNDTQHKPNTFSRIYQRIKHLNPQTNYRINLRVKGQNVSRIWFGGGPGWKFRQPITQGTFDWQTLSATFTTATDQTDFEFMILMEGQTDALWVDHIDVVLAK